MEIGDLVRLSPRKTRKGLVYEDLVGLVVDKTGRGGQNIEPRYVMCSVNFGGAVYDFNVTDLIIVEEVHTDL